MQKDWVEQFYLYIFYPFFSPSYTHYSTQKLNLILVDIGFREKKESLSTFSNFKNFYFLFCIYDFSFCHTVTYNIIALTFFKKLREKNHSLSYHLGIIIAEIYWALCIFQILLQELYALSCLILIKATK